MMMPQDAREALADPRSGVYYDSPKDRFVAVVFYGGKGYEIGWHAMASQIDDAAIKVWVTHVWANLQELAYMSDRRYECLHR